VACDDAGTAIRVEYESNLPHPQPVAGRPAASAAAPSGPDGGSAGTGPPVIGVADDLAWREHPPLSMFFGGVAAAMLDGGELVAAADPRREGAVAVSAAAPPA
jgi:hypothetical protein